jgi:TonB family protein
MKCTFSITLFFFLCLKGFSQDTIVVYLDSSYTKTSRDSASYIREAVRATDHISITDKKINGTIINYCEYKSLNPRLEHGKAIYYNEGDSIYSTGNYRLGRMTGKWIYYNKDNTVDTVDYSFSKDSRDTIDYSGAKYYTNNDDLKAIGYKILDSLPAFIKANFHMPARAIADTIRYFQSGISCIFDTEGKIRHPKITNSAHQDIQSEIYRILKLYHYDGEIKEPFMISSITFSYGEQTATDADQEEIFVVVEEMPSFPGGDVALLKYIYEKINYPEIAKDQNITGKVVVRFCVRSDGTVDNVYVSSGAHLLLDAEVFRVIKSLPKFTPGRQGGKPVNVWYSLPINFQLK